MYSISAISYPLLASAIRDALYTMNASNKFTWTFPNNTWVLKLVYMPQFSGGAFVASLSSGGLAVFSLNTLSSTPVLVNNKCHESSVNDITRVSDTVVASVSTDGVKLWDLAKGLSQPIKTFTNDKKSNFLSVASSPDGTLVAAGTELVGSDAELHVWQWELSTLVRSFVDSHHDDITAIEFHPTLTQYMMSGSTDGYVNIYDLTQEEEDEAIHQTINFASVHLCHFVLERRIMVLSHMETLAFYELNSTDYETTDEPRPTDIGDVRTVWPNCEYVIDVLPVGYAAFGCNLKELLSVMAFDAHNESFSENHIINFPSAHGEEVVRDLLMVPLSTRAVSCGEDGKIHLWELPVQLASVEEPNSKSKTVKKDKSKDKKDKSKDKKEKSKDKKERKEKDKSKRHGKDSRFKPY